MARTPDSDNSRETARSGVPLLGGVSARGMVWLFGQTFASRIVNFGVQIVLARLLMPEHFGVIGMAYTIRAFASVLQRAGMNRILVNRQREFDELATPGLWLSLLSGLLTGAVMLLAIPFAVRFYKMPDLAGLIVVMALTAPLMAAKTVPSAAMSIHLQFGRLALVRVGEIVGGGLLSVLFAMLGFGAYSFVLPPLLVIPLSAWIMFRVARVPLVLDPGFRHWRMLLGTSGLILLHVTLGVIVEYGDYTVLGRFCSAERVGVYFLAFSLSTQPIMLLSGNVSNTLFPVLSKLQDEPQRQVAGFLRSLRLLAACCIPMCFALAALAEPLVQVLYGAKWAGAVMPLRILSTAMALRCLGWVAGTYMQANGRFGILAATRAVWCALFLGAALWAVHRGLTVFTIAVGLMHVYDSIVNLLLAVGWSTQALKRLARVLIAPLVAATAGWLAVVPLLQRLPDGGAWDWGALVGGGVVFAAVAGGVMWLADRSLCLELLELRHTIVRRQPPGQGEESTS